MNHVKNLVKILLFAQCLLFCACDKKEIVTTEQNILNLTDFVKCPFNEEYDDKTNLEKYILKKFGKPDKFGKGRTSLGDADAADIVIDEIWLRYYETSSVDEKYSFVIYRGISKKFEVFARIYIYNYTDLKYRINENTTNRDIENLFGKPNEFEQKKIDGDDYKKYSYYTSSYNKNSPYYYQLHLRFKGMKLDYINIETRFRAEKL